MAYVTGSANSYADLQAALFSAVTANGYSVNGNVVSKGTMFCEVNVSASNPVGLTVHGGTGQSGGALTGRSNATLCYMGIAINTLSPTVTWNFTFPVTYSIHIGTAPDEVYMFVNYQTNCYQYIAFGQSDMPGLGGTGNWFAATARSTDLAAQSSWGYQTTGFGYANFWCASLFDGSATYGNQAGAVHHGMDGATNSWLINMSFPDRWQAQWNSPNAWNAESVLSPIVVYTTRPSGFVSPVLQMGHARWVMLDNLVDQQIITMGSERWKCYPVWRRGNARTQTPTPPNGGTGFLGHAIRYDGP
ncbi:MAG: hypothetical protein WA777_01725 [Rhodanobacter sp.]